MRQPPDTLPPWQTKNATHWKLSAPPCADTLQPNKPEEAHSKGSCLTSTLSGDTSTDRPDPAPRGKALHPPPGSAAPSCNDLLQLLQQPRMGSHLSQTSVRVVTAMRGRPDSDDSDAADGRQSAGLQPLADTQPTSPPHTQTRHSDPGSPSTDFSHNGFGYHST